MITFTYNIYLIIVIDGEQLFLLIKCLKIGRVSIECRKTKTKIPVINLANQKGRRQSSKPIKT